MATTHTLVLPALAPTDEQAAILAEPRTCAGCDGPAPRNGDLLCTRCERAIHTLLAAIRGDYGRLELQPGRHGTQGLPGPVGFKSKPPCALAPLSLQTVPVGIARGHVVGDVAPSRHGDADPDNLARAGEPTVVVLGRVADRCREHGLLARLSGPRTVIGESLRLERVAGQIAAAWWAGSALRALRTAARDLRRALGEDDPGVPLGGCPSCSARVRAYEGGNEARCTAGHLWSGSEAVRRLAVELGDAWLDGPALAAYLSGVVGRQVTGDVVRKRADRHGWSVRRAGRRPLYRLVDARWSYGLEWGPVVPPDGERVAPRLDGWVTTVHAATAEYPALVVALAAA